MSIKKFIIVNLGMFALAVLLTSVTCNGDPIYNDITISGLEVSLYDNSGEWAVVADTDTIPAVAFVIKADLHADFAALEEPAKPTFSLFPEAMAFSPAEYFESIETVSEIRIITMTDYDNDHPVNTDVSEYFLIGRQGYPHLYMSAAEFLKGGEGYTMTHYNDHIWFYLQTQPDNAGEYQFITEFELSDGRVLSDTCDLIYLTKAI